MQKKVYLKEIKIDEVLERLSKGQKIHFDKSDNYIEMYKNILVEKDKIGNIVVYNSYIYGQDDVAHFLDEVEEPEADESCIDKLCWVWCDNKYAKCVDILIEINTEETYKYRTKSNVWTHCQALTKEEASDFIKE